MSVPLIMLAVVVLCAYTMGTSIGFGGSIMTATFAALFLPIDFIVPVLVPLNLVTVGYLAIRHRRMILKDVLFKRIMPWTFVGLPIGLALFLTVHTENLRWALGFFVMCLSVWELVLLLRGNGGKARGPLPWPMNAFFLCSGGFVQGLWASGGPLIAYWASRNIAAKGDFRATLAGVWVILNTVMLIVHLAFGRINAETLRADAMLLPVLVLAIVLAERLHAKMPERIFRIAVYAILCVSGLALMLR
jgi:uncharacterized protein